MNLNFGGFIPISTVDWRGKSVSVVFLRRCPAHCWYCHNSELLSGLNIKPPEEILAMIKESSLATSGVIFSGGEATQQPDALLALATGAKDMGLSVGIQTNGVFPNTLLLLLGYNVLDKVSLDIKTTWENYNDLLHGDFVEKVKESLAICKQAYNLGYISEFECVITLFRGKESELPLIVENIGDVDIVVQQGVYGSLKPLSEEELIEIASKLPRSVKIRTREGGEKAIIYKQY